MKISNIVVIAATLGGLSVAWAEDRHEERREERPLPARPAPPRYVAHPAGAHPHGPVVRPHAIRVMAPKVVPYGGRHHTWKHWEHAEFTRPVYYWDWNIIKHVSCVAEDSYGDQYPVTEQTFNGFGLTNMSSVEDDALDRCYSESQGDQTCYIATCSHF